ncbi:RNA polymerase sigma factor [Mucilaginibacter arboris]|uniref:Sigma-70 family RNA polymerase sigma factor n=1 Tax=Mucilaginibacter arboris TaxID=2682090 RepID=A0A7K1SWQ6_9SPHI|nr:sigma-70 family RNA polymerase sigma factor [Mucilaginibacter arboris]MVN21678.1 sigma-70 family RNA polymerase sigma factor [Mucilaginibacter arboris]
MPKYPAIAEQELVRQCKHGDLKHQELLYKQFYGYAMGIGLRYLANRDDALEVVNDAFIKVFNTIKSVDEKLPFKPWLRKVIVNTAIDRRRKNLRNLAEADLDEAAFIATPALAVSKLNANDIVTMMQLLPELNRLVFNLYEVDGYNHEEIGVMLNIAASSSRVYLGRAKERLRKMILQQEEKG